MIYSLIRILTYLHTLNKVDKIIFSNQLKELISISNSIYLYEGIPLEILLEIFTREQLQGFIDWDSKNIPTFFVNDISDIPILGINEILKMANNRQEMMMAQEIKKEFERPKTKEDRIKLCENNILYFTNDNTISKKQKEKKIEFWTIQLKKLKGL